MRIAILLTGIFGLPLLALGLQEKAAGDAEGNAQAAALRAKIQAAPRLALQPAPLPIVLPPGQDLGMVSWMAPDPKTGNLWLIQRGMSCDPILELDPSGHILHSFGKGHFQVPHAIRLDPEGNIWTVDAGNSHIIEWNPQGKQLLMIDLSEPSGPSPSGFDGATDVAFAPGGRVFISDGYLNARIVEYTRQGKKVREWGSPGAGPGQFKLPHSLVVDERGILYVADRENGRIEKFDLEGRYLGEIAGLGRTYALALGPDGTLWASMQPMNEPPRSPGWLVELNRTTGKILGWVPVSERDALHDIAVNARGDPMTDVGNGLVQFGSR